MERQVETDQNRLEKGEINLTDLAQSEASFLGAKAKLIAAQNDLVTSKANFEKVIGIKPKEIMEKKLEFKLNLPENLAAAYNISKLENPELQISLYEYKKAKMDLIIAGSDLSPSATLSYKIAKQDDISSTVQDRTQQTVKATATWPLFSGGKVFSTLEKLKKLEIKNNFYMKIAKKK